MSTGMLRTLHRPDAVARRPYQFSWGVQSLSWRRFAVRKNFSNGRRKLINACAWDDDAVSAAMSFLCDAQESAALVLPELDIEMLALNLQFFRLDDVIHFALRSPSLGSGTLKWKKNPRLLREFLIRRCVGKKAVIWVPERLAYQRRMVAVSPPQPRLWCALILRPQACLIPSILVPIGPRTDDSPP